MASRENEKSAGNSGTKKQGSGGRSKGSTRHRHDHATSEKKSASHTDETKHSLESFPKISDPPAPSWSTTLSSSLGLGARPSGQKKESPSEQTNTQPQPQTQPRDEKKTQGTKDKKPSSTTSTQETKAKKEAKAAQPPPPRITTRLRTPKHDGVYGTPGAWKELVDGAFDNPQVSKLLERMKHTPSLHEYRIFYGKSGSEYEAVVSKARQRISVLPSRQPTGFRRSEDDDPIAEGHGASEVDAILACENGIQTYVEETKGTLEKICSAFTTSGSG